MQEVKVNIQKMSFDCSKCIHNCHGACCGPVPFSRSFLEAFRKEMHRPIKEVVDMGNDIVLPLTENLTCVFLDEDYSCSIYEARPPICKLFGNASHKNLTCPYQDKDGRIRDEIERAQIEVNMKNEL